MIDTPKSTKLKWHLVGALAALVLPLSACGDDSSSGPPDAAASSDAAAVADASGGSPDAGTSAPADPTAFTATYNAGTTAVDLAWTASAGPAATGYIVARSVTPPATTGGPADGTVYTAGETLTSGATVVYAGSAVTGMDTTPIAGGTNYYQVWAHNAGAQYSGAATASVDVPLGPQLGTISIAAPTTTATVTVNTQPSGFVLSGTASYDGATQELTLSLTVENQLPRLAFNVKASVTSVNQGTATTDGTYKTFATAYYGPEALDIGASKTRDIVIAGVDGASDPIVVNLEIFNNQAITVSQGSGNGGDAAIYDLSGAVFTGGAAMGGTFTHSLGRSNNPSNSVSTPAWSADGKFLYGGLRNVPRVIMFDMTTLTAVGSVELSRDATGVGFAGAPKLSLDGAALYTAVATGNHRYDSGAGSDTSETLDAGIYQLDFVKLDPATLAVVSKLALVTDSATHIKPGNMDITPDGTIAILPVVGAGMVYVIDLVNMALLGSVDVTANSIEPRAVAINAAGTTAAVVNADDTAGIDLIDIANRTFTTITPDAPGDGTKYGTTVLYGPDGQLYATDRDSGAGEAALVIYNPAAMTWTTMFTTGEDLLDLKFSKDGSMFWLVDENGSLHARDTATHDIVQLDGQDSVTISADWGHLNAISPF